MIKLKVENLTLLHNFDFSRVVAGHVDFVILDENCIIGHVTVTEIYENEEEISLLCVENIKFDETHQNLGFEKLILQRFKEQYAPQRLVFTKGFSILF